MSQLKSYSGCLYTQRQSVLTSVPPREREVATRKLAECEKLLQAEAR